VMQLHAISAAASWALGDYHDALSAAFAQFARAASPVALDAIWQGAAVAIVLFTSLRLAPRVGAAHRFTAWAAGFSAIAALPFLPYVAQWFSSGSPVVPSAPAAASAHAWFELDSRWALAIAALWLAASLLRLAQFVVHLARVHKLWKTATPIAGRAQAESFPAGVEICTTTTLDRPSVIGFIAPRILIPHWLYARLTPQELKQVVLHEVEHLRRHDDWTNLIQKLVLVLFPLNPALAWIERRLCREREMACDEGVVRKTQAPRAYAACLASLAERGLQRDLERRAEALSLAAWRRRPELVHRVHGILWRKPVLNPVAARALLGTFACGLLVASVELARCPQAVAFVAAPQPQQIAQTLSLPDAVLPARAEFTPVSAPALASNASGVHMIPAMAILQPSRSGSATATTHRTSQRPAAVSGSEIASRDTGIIGTPHETLLKAEMPQPNAEQAALQEQDAPQYFVVTAVEQVRTIPQSSREIADYDTSAVANPQSSGDKPAYTVSKPGAARAPQITITRLILRITPVATQTGSANNPANGTNQEPSRKSMPISHPVQQPAVIPIGNGWLVFQL